jgi:hypothetical protein
MSSTYAYADMQAWEDPPTCEIVTRAARWARKEETR